jgi:FtsP/CotA-like multicopper oxidase with cupredoxin domain
MAPRVTQTGRRSAGFGRLQALPQGAFGPVCAPITPAVGILPPATPQADYMGACPNYSTSPLMRKFVDSLPGLTAAHANNLGQFLPLAVPDTTKFPGSDYYQIGLTEYRQQMHSDLPAVGTKLRGYVDLQGDGKPHYLGPIILARKDKPVRVKFSNQLPTGPAGKLFLPVDTTLMGAGNGPDGTPYSQNRATLHLHGGNNPWISDGTPHQWTVPASEATNHKKGLSTQDVPDMPASGPGAMTFYWPNQQSGRLMFYHDHAYGLTRLNVYAGEAAGYLVTDTVEDDLITRNVIPGAPLLSVDPTNVYAYGIPLIIQDKGFVSGSQAAGTGTFANDPTWPSVVPAGTQEGDLWFPHVYMPNQNPSDPSGATAMGRWDYGPWFWPIFAPKVGANTLPCPTALNPNQVCPGTPNPSLVPETFVDTMVVNGTAYPYATVEAKPTRLRLLNATNDRYLNLQLYVADPLTISVSNPGSGYTTAPAVTIAAAAGDTTGAGATAAAVVSTGAVSDVLVSAGGSGYSTTPVVAIGAPVCAPNPSPTCATATASAAVSSTGGVITGILVTSIGAGYTSAPPVTITDGSGTGAVAAASITPAGAIASITVTNPGNGLYTLPPVVTIGAPAAGVTAVAIAAVNAEVKMVDALPHPGVNPPIGATPPCTQPEASAEALYLAGRTTGLPLGCWPSVWPIDARAGGVPDPLTAGPAMIQIGTEGGLLPAPVVVPSAPVNYEYNRRSIVVLNVTTHGLFMGPAERADVIVDFSGLAGKTLILYNDAPAPMPAFDPRNDYYTGAPDQTSTGGAPTTLPGFGPNTRTIMQIRVVAPATGAVTPFSLATLKTELPKAFAASFPLTGPDQPIVPESVYNAAYNPATPYQNTYARISDTSLAFTPVGQNTPPVAVDLEPKAIQELFEPDYARMNATLGVELPRTNNLIQTTIPLSYIDPPTEIINDKQTQVWKLTHNGVDTHTIHFHLFNVQVVNRVGWDGAIRPPDANELGWKESVRMSPLEDIVVALRPQKQTLPFTIPESVRPLDVTNPLGSTGQFSNIDPLTNNPKTIINQLTNFGWEYVWHCHLLGHEENDMMRPIVLKTAPIQIPQGLRATANAAPLSITLNWTAYVQNPSNRATGLTIMRRTDAAPTFTTIATLTNLATTTFTDKAVAYGTTYYYVMVAFNASDTSQMSNFATATTIAAPPVALATPTNLQAPAALITATSVRLTWKTVTGATNYIIQRSTDNGVTWTQVGLSPTANAQVTGLVTKTTYRFRVIATNGNPSSNSLPSASVTATTK